MFSGFAARLHLGLLEVLFFWSLLFQLQFRTEWRGCISSFYFGLQLEHSHLYFLRCFLGTDSVLSVFCSDDPVCLLPWLQQKTSLWNGLFFHISNRLSKQLWAFFQVCYCACCFFVVNLYDRSIGTADVVSRVVLSAFSLATLFSVLSEFFTVVTSQFGPVGIRVGGVLSQFSVVAHQELLDFSPLDPIQSA